LKKSKLKNRKINYQCDTEKKYIKKLFNILTKFKDDAREFYSKEDKKNDCISSTDRDGTIFCVPQTY